MPIQLIDLGTAPTGADGDTNREANTKTNQNLSTEIPRRIDAVAGGTGFVDASGATTLDVALGRAFLLIATADVAVTFDNIPSGDVANTGWKVFFRQDATGGHALTIANTIKPHYADALADINTSPNALNMLWFERVGGETFWSLYHNESVPTEPTMGFFAGADPETIGRPFSRTESLDLSDVTFRAQNGTAAAGTLAFGKNGPASGGTLVTGLTEFAEGDVLTITRTGSTDMAFISIPGFLG